MTAFYWIKATPGLYYLWEGEGAARVAVGKVKRLDTRRYLATFARGSHTHSVTARTNPQGTIHNLECAIFRLLPDATFTRRNF